jgi:hypothetical protein
LAEANGKILIHSQFEIMKNIVFACFILISASVCFGQKAGVTHVITHSRITMVTDPSNGINYYRQWGVFPGKEESIRKIVLHLTLGHPENLPIAHWDYLDFIKIKRAGGKNGKDLNYEIARMLTPYGSIFGKEWKWTWNVDVTDFSMLLRDSVEIEYAHSGYEPNTVGWSLTLDFEIVKGKEIIRPISIMPMWTGSFKYGDPKEDIEKLLDPRQFTVDTKSGISRFRINQTGHGMDQPKGCSEFCSRWREILLDGKVVDHTDLWKNCGNNPLYPQGGTWIYDRAAWCPGDLQQPWIYDLDTKSGNHTLDINMEPYTATSDMNAYENVTSWLIEYSTPLSTCDASIEKILVPNNDPNFSRFNPAIRQPVIVIRNQGSKFLKQLQITYGTKGFGKKVYLWKGNLAFNKTDTVTLPGIIEFSKGENSLEVFLKTIGSRDAWPVDNVLNVPFNSPKELPEKMILQFLTNNKPEENDFVISDISGKEIFSRKHESLEARKLYSDTLYLPEGKYQLFLTDSAGDGLEFWYEAESGYGYMRLLSMDGRILHAFEPDCGDGQFLAFTTSPGFSPDTTVNNCSFVLFPRRVKGPVSLDLHSDRPASVEVIITSDGVPVEKHQYVSLKQAKLTYDLSYLKPGRYIMEVLVNGESKFKRRFNKE